MASTSSTNRRPSSSSASASAAAHTRPRRGTAPAYRTFVLDTSVLLSDPRAMLRFAEHEVVLPVVVVTELEGKRHHPEPSRGPRCGCWTSCGSRRVGSTHRSPSGKTAARCGSSSTTDPSSLPAGFRLGDNDTRILSVAKNLSNEGHDVTIVSKDLPMRVKASAVGLAAEEYRAELAVDSGWTGDRARRHGRGDGRPLRARAGRARPGCRAAVPHRAGAARRGAAGSGGWARTSRSGSCGVTATPSACTAAAPSSASRSTCCSTPMSASSASAGAPGPARALSPCAPASRRS